MIWTWAELKRILKGRAPANDNEKYIAVMWPVMYPENLPMPPDEPHSTVVMLGTTDEATFTKGDILSAMREAGDDPDVFLWATVVGLEFFGPDKDVPVLKIDHTYLYKYHDRLEAALLRRGIESDKTYAYSPHVTLNPDAPLSILPDNLVLKTPELWWGAEHISV